MTTGFVMPDFSVGQLEFRADEEGVAIYGTREGLRALARFCEQLAAAPTNQSRTDHVHLEDRGILTGKSLNAAIAYFDED
jgi:hypothetical protein